MYLSLIQIFTLTSVLSLISKENRSLNIRLVRLIQFLILLIFRQLNEQKLTSMFELERLYFLPLAEKVNRFNKSRVFENCF